MKTLEEMIWILDGSERDTGQEAILEQMLAGNFWEILKDKDSQIQECQWIPSRINKNKHHSEILPENTKGREIKNLQKLLENQTNHLQRNSHCETEGLFLNSKSGCHKSVSSTCQEELSVSAKFYIQRKYLSKMRATYRHLQTTQTENLSLADFPEGNLKI